jgi:hypothetical protein
MLKIQKNEERCSRKIVSEATGSSQGEEGEMEGEKVGERCYGVDFLYVH